MSGSFWLSGGMLQWNEHYKEYKMLVLGAGEIAQWLKCLSSDLLQVHKKSGVVLPFYTLVLGGGDRSIPGAC